MNSLVEYVDLFFDDLEIFEDIHKGHNYKTFIHQAILEFLQDENKKNAFAVYDAFFDSYRIQISDQNNPFIDLLDILKDYEENAATLINRQRDHYIHAVNVFILGLCIYSQNSNYKKAFTKKKLNKIEYPFSYSTAHEEFFYRWGIASLFHDIGYPVEIIGKQIRSFIDFTTGIDSKIQVHSHLEFDKFEDLNAITEVIPKQKFIHSYYQQYKSCVYVDLLKPVDLLAHELHLSLGLDLKEVLTALNDFVNVMARFGFIDHGFYSALIVLRWYGYLIQKCGYKPEYFFFPVLDSASAILLHNYYRNVIMKPPFEMGSLSPSSHPIAFLLILCDELQEWNRQAYGILDRNRIQAGEATIEISDQNIKLTYISSYGKLPADLSMEKEKLINHVLDIPSIFANGLCINCESKSDSFIINNKLNTDNAISARPLLNNLEKLGIAIHDMYVENQKENFPDKQIIYPTFADLPESMKYSNLRQARSITEKIKLAGWQIQPNDFSGRKITKIPEGLVEWLARIEHEDWVKERISSGWTRGDEKDTEKKVSPYLIPYDELTESIKENDRDTIRSIPELLKMVGLAIYE